MPRCRVVVDPIFAAHNLPSHPENNARLEEAARGIPHGVPRVPFCPALPADLERFHAPSYLSWLEKRCVSTDTVSWLDPDTYITRRSYEVALNAAGAAIAAVEQSLKGDHCFAFVRPPGHHAEHDRAMGFCLINNVAVAAQRALCDHERIAIVDWDVHHGNGTQQAFYRTSRVLYCSVHQEHIFPYSGSAGESGSGEGRGFTINAPLPAGSGGDDYLCLFEEIFAPAIRRFSPEVLIVSAGQDILSDDPLGSMLVQPEYLEPMTRLVRQAAGVPLALVLEGGYGPSHGAAISAIFRGLRDNTATFRTGKPSGRTETIIQTLRSVHHILISG